MALIEWKDSLSVEVAEIDAQHKELVRMINELNDAMLEGKARDVLSNIIGGLASYTVSHFGNEEKYFARFGYAGAIAHKGEHDRFVKKVGEYKEQFDSGAIMLSVEIMRFLKDWLVNHIQGTDKKYIPCFHENGLR